MSQTDAIRPLTKVPVPARTVLTSDSANTPVELPSPTPESSDETLPVSASSSVLLAIPDPSAAVISAADALRLLNEIAIGLEHRGGYNRDLFAVWSDLDGNGCDAREDVLAEEAVTTATRHGCETVGTWRSAYDGRVLTSAAEVAVDHVVALKEAWESGAWAWTVELRIAFANDITDNRTLVAVSAPSNISKSDNDPANWLPSDPAAVCSYLIDWVAIKHRWHLTMDPTEWDQVRIELTSRCR